MISKNKDLDILKNIFHEGVNFFHNEDFLNAEKKFESILLKEPNRISVLNNLAATKIKLGKFKESEIIALRVLNIDSENCDAQFHLSICKGEQFLFSESIKLLDSLISKKNAQSEVYIQKARMLNKLGKFFEAKQIYEKVLETEPGNHLAKWNLSLQNLFLRNFELAWEGYASRFQKDKKLKKKHNNIQELNFIGDNLKNKKIVIWCEQGYGDIIQFSRYLLLLQNYQCEIFIELAQPIVSLFNYFNAKIKINQFDFYDYQISIMDLPKVFNATFDTIIDNTPYFTIPDDLVTNSSKLLIDNKKINVGLAWSGRADFGFDSLRSLRLSDLHPILSLKKQFNFYCLQKDVRKVDEQLLVNNDILHVGKNLDFLQTATFIENLDLVISSDTSILHLSGALGKSTYAMLAYCPDWRWFLNLDYSPWYRSVKLFRSNKFNNDWSNVVNEIKNELMNNFI